MVKAFELINPHMRLTLTVTDAKGTRDIRFEGHSLNNMYRSGYRKDMVKVGDKLTVVIAPKKDGLTADMSRPASPPTASVSACSRALSRPKR